MEIVFQEILACCLCLVACVEQQHVHNDNATLCAEDWDSGGGSCGAGSNQSTPVPEVRCDFVLCPVHDVRHESKQLPALLGELVPVGVLT